MSKKVLLVEDNPNISDLYAESIKTHGIEVVQVLNGEQALDTLKEEQYDLVLLDIMLPGQNGISVLKELKQDDKTKDLPVFMLTVLNQKAMYDQSKSLGATGFLVKDKITPDSLAKIIEEYFSDQQTPAFIEV